VPPLELTDIVYTSGPARRLGVEPERAAVVEDALAGVEAGRRGGSGPVVGMDRTGHAQALLYAGADVVVRDLAGCAIGSSWEHSVWTSASNRPPKAQQLHGG